MSQIINCLRMDLRRSFFSIGFAVSTIGVCALFFLGAWSEFNLYNDVLYYFKYSMEVSGFGYMLPMFCVLPYAASFCSDFNSQYLRFATARTNQTGYAWSKVAACALSGGASVAMGLSLFIVIASINHVLVAADSSNFEFFSQQTLGGYFLTNGQDGLYFAVYVYLSFLAGVFWSVAGLCVSSYIPNKFVPLTMPFILSYVLTLATSRLPLFLRLNRIVDGSFILGNTFISLLYASILFLLLSLAAGLLFKRNVKRRLANG